MANIKKLACLSGMLMLIGTVVGCDGYSADPLHPRGIKTIYIPMPTVSKKIYRRQLEQRLQECLVKNASLRTGYSIAKRPNADAELICEIKNIVQSTTSTNPDDDTPRETELTFFLSVKMRNINTGNTVFEDQNMQVAVIYLPSEPFNEDFFRGSEDLMDRIARRVFEKMERRW